MKELAEFLAAFLDLPTPVALLLLLSPVALALASCLWIARVAYRRGYENAEVACRHGFEKYDKTVRL